MPILYRLTMSNLEETERRFRALLEGKTYTFYSRNLAYDDGPRIRRSQSFEHGGSYVWRGDDGTYGGIHVNDTYGVWGFSTFNPEIGALVSIGSNVIHINHTNTFGQPLLWIITVEE